MKKRAELAENMETTTENAVESTIESNEVKQPRVKKSLNEILAERRAKIEEKIKEREAKAMEKARMLAEKAAAKGKKVAVDEEGNPIVPKKREPKGLRPERAKVEIATDENLILSGELVIGEDGKGVSRVTINNRYILESVCKDSTCGASKTALYKIEEGEKVLIPEFNNIGVNTMAPYFAEELNVRADAFAHFIGKLRLEHYKEFIAMDKTEIYKIREQLAAERAAKKAAREHAAAEREKAIVELREASALENADTEVI